MHDIQQTFERIRELCKRSKDQTFSLFSLLGPNEFAFAKVVLGQPRNLLDRETCLALLEDCVSVAQYIEELRRNQARRRLLAQLQAPEQLEFDFSASR